MRKFRNLVWKLSESGLDRFLRYVKVDTQSDEGSETNPSTKKQFDLANMLVDELKQMGVSDARVDENCYVYATLEANLPDGVSPDKVPAVAFVAHMDTSPEEPGANVDPQIIKYEGGDIVLKDGSTISPDDIHELNDYVGMDIVTTDGTTLLGADDKAGIAEIMTAVERLIEDRSIYHGTMKICFTPDEEVGRGVDNISLDDLGAKIAYTMDGGEMGEIEDETFNAALAVFTIKGYNVHPGYAKDKMINSVKTGTRIMELVGAQPSPENTEGREGYLHIHNVNGSVDKTVIKILIRDHDIGKMEEKREFLRGVYKQVQDEFPNAKVDLDIKEYYQNMKVILDEHPLVVQAAVDGVRRAGIEPKKRIIRGGTDGARLSFMGVPTPNIFGGGLNFHSKKEFIPVPAFEYGTKTVIEILKIYYEQAQE